MDILSRFGEKEITPNVQRFEAQINETLEKKAVIEIKENVEESNEKEQFQEETSKNL